MRTREKQSAVINHHIKNPNDTIHDMANIFKCDKSSISVYLEKYYDRQRKIFVVPSLFLEETYFAFNGITERKFTVNMVGLVDERHLFTKKERLQLKELGFSF